MPGTLTPGALSSREELTAIAQAVAEGGGGAFEMSTDFSTYDDVPYQDMDQKKLQKYRMREVGWLMDIARKHGKEVGISFNCFPDPAAHALPLLQAIADAGGLVRGQCVARAQGLLQAFGSRAHPFTVSQTFMSIQKRCRDSGLDLLATLRRSGQRDTIIKDTGPKRSSS